MENNERVNNEIYPVMFLCAFGLVADLYDFGVINLVRPMLIEENGAMDPTQDSLITGATILGSFFGMLFFGAMADHIGRRNLFIITAAMVGVSTLGCALATPMAGMGIYTVLTIWRFILGLGIGGEYPLAAACIAENSGSNSSGLLLATGVVGMSVGIILAPLVLIFCAGPLGLPNHIVWRCCFAFGAVLALLVAGLRWMLLRETQAWEASHLPEAQIMASRREAGSSEHVEETPANALLTMKRSLLGAMGSWFIYDVVAYGVGMYSTTIFPAKPGLGNAKVQLGLAVLSCPGAILGIFLAKQFSMKHNQLLGFGAEAAIFGLLRLLSRNAGSLYYFTFVLNQFVGLMTLNVTTFSIPGQIFPTRIRATGHGLSAAAGKAGGFVGTVIFPHLNAAAGMDAVMFFMVLMCLVGVFWTHIFTPLYSDQVLQEIAALDTTAGQVKQAALAEALLFSDAEQLGKDESPPLESAPLSTDAKTADYGNATA